MCSCDCGCADKKDCLRETEHDGDCRECHCYRDSCPCVTEEVREEEVEGES